MVGGRKAVFHGLNDLYYVLMDNWVDIDQIVSQKWLELDISKKRKKLLSKAIPEHGFDHNGDVMSVVFFVSHNSDI